MLKSVKYQVKDVSDNNVYFSVTEKFLTHWPLVFIVDNLDMIIAERILNEVWFEISDRHIHVS